MDTSNITEAVNSAVNSLYTSLIKSFNGDTIKTLDNIAFIDSKIIDNKFFDFFLNNQSHSIVYIAESFLLAYLIYYAISYLFSHFSGNPVENPFQFLIKLLVCAVCVNFSYFICSQIIDLVDIVGNTIKNIALESTTIRALSFDYFYTELQQSFTLETISSMTLFSFDGFLYLFMTMGIFNLLLTYSYRYILIKLLILLSPFFILSASLNSTRWLFKMWLKNFISLLCIQLIVLFLMLIFSNLDSSLINSNTKILYIASLFSIIKASSFVKDFSSGFTHDVNSGISTLKNIFN